MNYWCNFAKRPEKLLVTWCNFAKIPLDTDAILESAARTGKVVTAEEHQRLGGLGGSVSQVLAENNPTPMRMVAVDDSFGESGTPTQLMDKYGLNADAIVTKTLEIL